MKKRLLWTAAIAASLAVAGCACLEGMVGGGTKLPPADQVCDGTGVCQVEVSVAGCPGGITVDKPVTGVKAGVSLDIMWKLPAGNAWAFTSDGIKFKTESCAAEFDGSAANKNVFKWHDKNPRGAAHACDYAITLVNSAGTVCHVDPTIINGI